MLKGLQAMKIEESAGKIILIENQETQNEMRFGIFDKSDIYVVERHKFNNQRDNNIKTVEFILVQNSEVILVEAKPKTSQEYFEETSCKMFDSLNKFFSFIAKRNTDIAFHYNFEDFSSIRFRFYLIVSRLDIAFAEQATDTFVRTLTNRFSNSFLNVWNIDIPKNTLVMSYETAKTTKLIN
jgi:hypothetical protein